MSYAFFPNLTRTIMTNLSNYDITVIALTYSNIRQLAHDTFADFRHLKRLEIVNTYLRLKEEEMWYLLSPLRSLTHLTMEKIGQGFFPADLLWRFPKLEKVVMSANRLSSEMLSRILQNVTSVRHLNVRSNDITVVDEDTLSLPFRRHVKYLDLTRNPFSCTCQLRWFKRWLDQVTANGTIHVKEYTKNYGLVCDTPPERRRLPILDFHLSDDDCKEEIFGIVLGIVGLCLLLVVIVASLLAYRYRLYLRSYLYRLRRRRRDGQGERPPHTEFDLYLACSSRDTEWVCNALMPFLQDDHRLSTFLRERDAPLGIFVADSITEFIDKSARILLLISDNYTSEAWCQYEFQHIIYAAIDQQKDVIVVLKDVTTGVLTRDMIRILTRGTYLQWGSSDEAQRLFREGLAVALRTVDTMYDSLC
ncbi:hypothetical protein ACOMHN_037024 [Nucella lapillus]